MDKVAAARSLAVVEDAWNDLTVVFGFRVVPDSTITRRFVLPGIVLRFMG
jgi:hypothetical protein